MRRKPNGQFEKGKSGNPSGRPKRSEVEKQMIADICSLAPQAVKALKNLIEDDDTPPNVRIRAIDIIIERVCGKVQSASIEGDMATMDKLDTLLSEVLKEAYAYVDCPTGEQENKR